MIRRQRACRLIVLSIDRHSGLDPHVCSVGVRVFCDLLGLRIIFGGIYRAVQAWPSILRPHKNVRACARENLFDPKICVIPDTASFASPMPNEGVTGLQHRTRHEPLFAAALLQGLLFSSDPFVPFPPRLAPRTLTTRVRDLQFNPFDSIWPFPDHRRKTFSVLRSTREKK